jgi:hypothetical protein
VNPATVSSMKDVMAELAAFQGEIRAVRALPRPERMTKAKELVLLNQKKARRLAINKPLILCAIRISARGGLRWVCAQLRIRNRGLWLMSRG